MSDYLGEPVSILLKHGATNRAVSALQKYGVETVADLVSLREIDLYRIPRLGRISRENVIKTLGAMGLSIRPDEDYALVYAADQAEFEEISKRRKNFIICPDDGKTFNRGDMVKVTNRNGAEDYRFIHQVTYGRDTDGILADGYCVIGF